MISIAITNRQKRIPIDRRRLRATLKAILRDAAVADARISIAMVDDPTIAKLHDQFLDDPDPTDVLSFLLERSPEGLEGEVVASADTAAANARRYGATPEEELLRYAIHGTLHLVGHDDQTPRDRAAMRRLERRYLGATEMTKPK
ncbi:MAG: rRNA maturation RNase YbeY [Thermoguttaceae bacterium]